MWSNPPTELRLDPDEAHVWSAGLDLDEHRQKFVQKVLSPDEIERSKSFKFDKDRRRFIAARGILRSLTGQYLQIAPEDVVFQFGEYGKPHLSEKHSLQFNISHSENLALFGFTQNRTIGIDLEFIGREIEFEDIAGRFFSRNEFNNLMELPEDKRAIGFYNCWTRKEAFIKAIGEGLSFPLDKFEVSLKPEIPAKMLATHWNPEDASKWSIYSLSPKTDFVGALVIKGKIAKLECRHWS